jgi:hypothetical protein
MKYIERFDKWAKRAVLLLQAVAAVAATCWYLHLFL